MVSRGSKKKSSVSFFIVLFERTGGPSIDFLTSLPQKKAMVRLMSSSRATGRGAWSFFSFVYMTVLQRQSSSKIQLIEFVFPPPVPHE